LAVKTDISGQGEAALAAQQDQLRSVGVDSKVGSIRALGYFPDGQVDVTFVSEGEMWGSQWPAWTLSAVRDALLHGKQIWSIYEKGAGPFGHDLLVVVLLSWPV